MSTDAPTINPHWLKQLPQLKGLSNEAINEIASKTVIESMPAGRRLFLKGQMDRWHFYLVEGHVALTAPGTPPQTITANTPAAFDTPLAPAQPRPCTAFSVSPLQFIRIDSQLLELLNSKHGGEIVVGEISNKPETLEEQVFLQFYQDYMQDKMSLPSLPDIAVRVRTAAQNTDNGPNELAKIIQADPGLSTQLLQAANSARYGGQPPVSTLRLAVTRLGMDATRDIATSFALRQLFNSHSNVLRKELFAVWQHAARVAAISFILAKHTPGIDPDRAMLAGLIHDIGSLPIINHADRHAELLEDPNKLHRLIKRLKAQIGAMILRKWKFPTDLVTAALEPEDWSRDPDKSADLCDIVLMAQAHSYIGTPTFAKLPRLDEMPAFRKIAGGKLTPEESMAILEESKAEIQEMIQLLGGN